MTGDVCHQPQNLTSLDKFATYNFKDRLFIKTSILILKMLLLQYVKIYGANGNRNKIISRQKILTRFKAKAATEAKRSKIKAGRSKLKADSSKKKQIKSRQKQKEAN